MLHVLYSTDLHAYKYDGYTYVITIMMSNAVCSDRQPGNWPMLIISDVRVVLHWYDAHFPASHSPPLSHLLLISCCWTNAIGSGSRQPRYLRVCSARAQKLSDFRASGIAVAFYAWPSLERIAPSRSVAAVSAAASATLGNRTSALHDIVVQQPSFDNLLV